jgi:hypothetical protein
MQKQIKKFFLYKNKLNTFYINTFSIEYNILYCLKWVLSHRSF